MQESKPVRLKNGTTVKIRPLAKRDGPTLLEFFRALPDDDRLFLDEDVTREEVVERWLEEQDSENIVPIVAEKDSAIVGNATLHLNRCGWQRSMAEIRCVVSRELQQNGLGTILMRELIAHADQNGVSKITAKMMESQVSAQSAFQRLGFRKEYELKDFAVDTTGKSRRLVIMVSDISEQWRTMEDLIIYSDMRKGN